MGELIKAILEGDTKQVRFLAEAKPALLQENSVVGTAPLRLAFDKGQVNTQVALIRFEAPGSELIKDVSSLLIDYIRELSQSLTCAGWLNQIEYCLWQAVVLKEPMSEDAFAIGELDNDTKEDLRFLAERSGGWATYLENGPSYVSQEEWLRMFRNWR